LPFGVRRFLMSKVERFYDSWVARTDHKADRAYNVSTTETYEMSSSSRAKATFDDGTFVWSTPYYQLKKLKEQVKPKPSDVLLDIGCGPGRVCFEFAHSEIGKCVGIELDGMAYQAALENLDSYTGDPEKIRFINGDILNYPLTDESILFLSNPFGANTMKQLVQNISRHALKNSRDIQILYYNPLCHDIIVESPNVRLANVMRGFRKPIHIYTVSSHMDDDGRGGMVPTSTVSVAH
jgi:SAM-dependent methyltransferase